MRRTTLVVTGFLTSVIANFVVGCAPTESESREDVSAHTAALNTLPTEATYLGKGADSSELNNLESEEHQGIAACPGSWIWSTKDKIMRVPRPPGGVHMTKPLEEVREMPTPLANMGYDHFGDGECFNGHYYVTVNKEKSTLDSVTLEYSEHLELLAFGRTPTSVAAVNPRDGMLYAQSGLKLVAYNRSKLRRFRWDPASCGQACWRASEYDQADLRPPVRTVTLVPRGNPGWWAIGETAIWLQGGAFSSNGVFYMTVDHGGPLESNFTGIHAFNVPPFDDNVSAPAFPIPGVEDQGIFPVRYKPSFGDPGATRVFELEGVTVYTDPGYEHLHYVVASLARNDCCEDDNVTTYHFTSNEAYSPTLNDYWNQQPTIW